jgi:signal transduction histidine kinase
MFGQSRHTAKLLAILVWLLFTVSLTAWWYNFSQHQIQELIQLTGAASEELLKNQKMLRWEGACLMISLAGGGAALFYFVYRELKLNQNIREFFAAFSHELKTPIASLRLQAESLQEEEDLQLREDLIERILADTVRLNSRLENTLFLANLEHCNFFPENISLQEILKSAACDWPNLKVQCVNDCLLDVDRQAFESIIRNILQNSVAHGRADSIAVELEPVSDQRVKITFRDNGMGFQGRATSQLAEPFVRHYQGSGTGIGLFLIKQLSRRLNGHASFSPLSSGFEVSLGLPGKVAP